MHSVSRWPNDRRLIEQHLGGSQGRSVGRSGRSPEIRASSKANYIGLTATIRAHSRQQLDGLYLALTAHPLVKIVL
ncbi:MAG: DUF493 family protein [Betaproteobacteria bacterium]|nr:DUF493 family protein [Betaproteobacteria bacterium]